MTASINTNGTDANLREDEDVTPPLDQDHSAPFTPAAPGSEFGAELEGFDAEDTRVNDSHPATDAATDIDAQELYDEGLNGAAGLEEPNAGNAVLGYDPSKDQRRK